MLYIIRHGKTDWNNRYKVQGQTDILLNEEGRNMAEKAREEYKDVHFDVCYSSPLERAKETAEILLRGRAVPIITDDRLKEMSFGSYEGFEKCYEKPDCPLNVFFKTPESYTEPVEGAKSLDALFARTGVFLREIVYPGLEQGKDIVIVGHAAMNCSIVCQVQNKKRSEFWNANISNCKLMKLI